MSLRRTTLVALLWCCASASQPQHGSSSDEDGPLDLSVPKIPALIPIHPSASHDQDGSSGDDYVEIVHDTHYRGVLPPLQPLIRSNPGVHDSRIYPSPGPSRHITESVSRHEHHHPYLRPASDGPLDLPVSSPNVLAAPTRHIGQRQHQLQPEHQLQQHEQLHGATEEEPGWKLEKWQKMDRLVRKTGSIYPLLTKAQKAYVIEPHRTPKEITHAFGIRWDEVGTLKGQINTQYKKQAGSFDPDTQANDLKYEEEKNLEEQAEAGWKLTEAQKGGVRSSEEVGGVKHHKFRHLDEEQKRFIKDQRYTLAVLAHAFDAPKTTVSKWRKLLLP